jgi:Ca2+-binding RTX toxin-like protein
MGFGGDADGDFLVDIENLSGSGFGDWLIGDDHNNVLSGLGGNDTLWGGDGGDRLDGGDGADTLNGGGNTVRLTVGGALLTAREGDVLMGGHGADKFVFSSIDDIGNALDSSLFDPGPDPLFGFSHAADMIFDFDPAEGDKIDLRPIDADETVSGNQDFSTTFVPQGEPFTAPGQISWWINEGAPVGAMAIVLNTDADPFADATIQLAWDAATPDASWFVWA